MSNPVLQISQARRAFADRQALQDVSLTVEAGEIVALLGPNGAGKTSLMRAATGRLRLGSGEVALAGMNPYKDAAARQALGIVPQTIALYPQLTARENLDIFARLMGLKGRSTDDAVDKALERAGLTDRAADQISELSGGMQRRLNIVAGTLHNPSLLLLDEPTVGVDLTARQRIHDLLAELRASGMAILFSTHDFDQASAVADRVVFMDAGKVLLEGRVTDLIRNVFGGNKELVVSLARAAENARETLLRELQLNPLQDRMTWSGPLEGGVEALADIERRFTAAGLEVAELSLREPGLHSVYMQVTGRSLQ